jgi:hypothetical protein
MAVEPSRVRANTTVYWERVLSDYSADDSWTATYKLNASGLATITITTTGSGTTHTVDSKPATTTGWAAGDYVWVLLVTDGTDTFELDTGTIEVVAENATGNDLLDAQNYLAAAEAELGERVTGKPSSYSIKDRSLTRMDEGELRKTITYWRKRVQVLEDAERRRKGQKSKRIIHARF